MSCQTARAEIFQEAPKALVIASCGMRTEKGWLKLVWLQIMRPCPISAAWTNGTERSFTVILPSRETAK